MRPIKFRAFNPTDNIMYYQSDGLRLKLNHDGGVSVMLLKQDAFKCELMQFTGLLDKNGKEIYEGDILASAWDTMLRLWLIEFSDGSFTNVTIGGDGYLGERFKLTQEKCSERVVVGNRFERPDLLK